LDNRFVSVLGLGFGDCGKGLFVDALTRRWHAHTVVRFNGGAQAGHNVVTPERHHTFAQFTAGTLVPGTRSVLLDPMVCHPTALLAEAEALAHIGVDDALPRLTIDAHCRVTTPYHQAAGRLREILRRDAAHGTCGVGVGETVRHAFAHPEQVIRYGDLTERALADKLFAARDTLFAEFEPLAGDLPELEMLRDESIAVRWLSAARAVARQCPPAAAETIRRQLKQPGAVLFEGAQGVLLDEWRGFHPHTTWSSITTAAVERAVERFGLAERIEHFGVLRTYLTRHGIGPLPTYDESLDDRLPEPHNHSGSWQGPFRRGHPDAVLLRYALDAVGPLSGLLVSHLDVFARQVSLKWCERYDTASRLPLGRPCDLSHQVMLTTRLMDARPQYAVEPVASECDYFARLAAVTDLPVVCRSRGNTSASVESHVEHESSR
jgi:adenylosuccinate synthase